jgi:hypothetical protein
MPGKKPFPGNTIVPDESGLLSLDFMVGLSIFMLAFMIVATMTSSLLVGLQSHTIDYDAVAYRTGVVLTEDPGEIDETVGISYIAPDRYSWDLIYPEYWDQYHESNIMRMGLMIPRYYYDTPPRVIMSHKTTEFFKPGNYDQNFYKDKIIFGDYPYRFNVSLMALDGTSSLFVGDQVPENTTMGYIKRVVLIKNPTWMSITNIFLNNESGYLTITYDFRNVSEGDPAYMIYPSLERSIINLTNFPEPDTYNMTYLQVCSPTCEDPEPLSPTIVLKNYANPGYEYRFPDLGLGMQPLLLNNTSYLEIEPGYFTRRYFPTIGPVDSIDIKMRIEASNSTNTTDIGGYYEYYYTAVGGSYVHDPSLIPGILEVRVW